MRRNNWQTDVGKSMGRYLLLRLWPQVPLKITNRVCAHVWVIRILNMSKLAENWFVLANNFNYSYSRITHTHRRWLIWCSNEASRNIVYRADLSRLVYDTISEPQLKRLYAPTYFDSQVVPRTRSSRLHNKPHWINPKIHSCLNWTSLLALAL